MNYIGVTTRCCGPTVEARDHERKLADPAPPKSLISATSLRAPGVSSLADGPTHLPQTPALRDIPPKTRWSPARRPLPRSSHQTPTPPGNSGTATPTPRLHRRKRAATHASHASCVSCVFHASCVPRVAPRHSPQAGSRTRFPAPPGSQSPRVPNWGPRISGSWGPRRGSRQVQGLARRAHVGDRSGGCPFVHDHPGQYLASHRPALVRRCPTGGLGAEHERPQRHGHEQH